jgi:hypothetical protein
MPLLKPTRALQIDFNHPLTRGLTGCWLMNEATGGIVADSGSRRNNGGFQYSTSAPAWKQGKYGSALEFGSERCIDCGTGKFGWDITNEISVIASVNQSASQTNTLFARSGFVRPCRLSAFSSGRFKWWVYTDGANCVINSTSTHPVDGSEFVHVAGTWRAGDGRIYVNGKQEASESSSSGSLSFVNDSQPVGIGGTYEGSNYYYCLSGKIEYVLVYNRVLSAEEIRWLYRQPFAMFARTISPALIAVTTAMVSLAGSASATSAGSATLTLTESLPEIKLNWLNDALFNGMTSNAFKLGTTLSLGWFWTRTFGCSALYSGPGIEQIDFDTVLTVGQIDAREISPPDYLPHESNSTYFYTIRRYNHCGYQEHTLAAIAKFSLDTEGELVKPQPNKIYAAGAEQVDTNKVLLTWFYCPLEQDSQPDCFNIYYDNRTGQIDYKNPLATISFKGQKFYSYQSSSFETGKYLFAIRAEDTDGNENSSSACLSIELGDKCPDAIDILQADTFQY